MKNIRDKIIKIAKKGIADNAIIEDDCIVEFDCNDFDNACEAIADEIMENLPELLADSEWVKLPSGWLNCLKLLVCGASCYAGIMDILQQEMEEHKDYTDLYAKIPQVQGFRNRLDLELLSDSKIGINTINGFEELLKIMRFTKEKAEAEAKLAELKGVKK